jgi:hypothetical protein
MNCENLIHDYHDSAYKRGCLYYTMIITGGYKAYIIVIVRKVKNFQSCYFITYNSRVIQSNDSFICMKNA